MKDYAANPNPGRGATRNPVEVDCNTHIATFVNNRVVKTIKVDPVQVVRIAPGFVINPTTPRPSARSALIQESTGNPAGDVVLTEDAA